MIKSILCTTLVLFLAHHVGRAQVVVNPDGSHSVLAGNVVVNPNGTHSVIAGNVVVNSNGTHSVIMGNVLVNPDGSHSKIPAVLKSADAIKRKSASRTTYRKSGNFEKLNNKLFGKGRNRNQDLDTKCK
jgi:hypothetical protein